jgi:hypothetical protein
MLYYTYSAEIEDLKKELSVHLYALHCHDEFGDDIPDIIPVQQRRFRYTLDHLVQLMPPGAKEESNRIFKKEPQPETRYSFRSTTQRVTRKRRSSSPTLEELSPKRTKRENKPAGPAPGPSVTESTQPPAKSKSKTKKGANRSRSDPGARILLQCFFDELMKSFEREFKTVPWPQTPFDVELRLS